MMCAMPIPDAAVTNQLEVERLPFCDVAPGLLGNSTANTGIDSSVHGEVSQQAPASDIVNSSRTSDMSQGIDIVDSSPERRGRRRRHVSFSEENVLHYTYGRREGNRKAYDKKEMNDKKWRELHKLNEELFPNGQQYGDGTASPRPTTTDGTGSPRASSPALLTPLHSLGELLHFRRHSK